MSSIDYDYLTKVLSEGSTASKSDSLKKLAVLAVNDRKQFVSNIRKILLNLEDILCQDKDDLNTKATILLLEILPNIVSKDVEHILKSKLLKYIVRNLGDLNKPTLRKNSHNCLLQYVKAYHNFDNIIYHYMRQGMQSQSWQLQQKCINSFQSILILEVKHLNWGSYEIKRILEALLDKLTDENNFVSKAAAQCLGSFCKMQSVKIAVENLSLECLTNLKSFVKTEVEQYELTVSYLQEVIQSKIDNLKKKQKPKPAPFLSKQQPAATVNLKPITPIVDSTTHFKNSQSSPKKTSVENQNKNIVLRESREIKNTIQMQQKPDSQKPEERQQEKNSPQKNPTVLTSEYKRLQKIKRNLKMQKKQDTQNQEPIMAQQSSINNIFNKKLLENFKAEGNLKDRLEAAQQILSKIEINKHKPELQWIIRGILPSVIKLLSDQNFKLVLVGLKILQNVLESSYFNPEMASSIIPALLLKLSDPKISVRQSVYKLIKLLMRSTDKTFWVESLLNILKNDPNPFQKDEIFNLILYLYEQYKDIEYDTETIVRTIAPFMEDPKTKIKIKTLDCLALIASKNEKIQQITELLKELVSAVFHEMFLEKVSKYRRNVSRRRKILKIHAAVSDAASLSSPSIDLEKTINLDNINNNNRSSIQVEFPTSKMEIQRQYQSLEPVDNQNSYQRREENRINLTNTTSIPRKQYESVDSGHISLQVSRQGLFNLRRHRPSLRQRPNRSSSRAKDESSSHDLFLPSLARSKNVEQPKATKATVEGYRTMNFDKSSKATKQISLSNSNISPPYAFASPTLFRAKESGLQQKGSEYLNKFQLKALHDPDREMKELQNSIKDQDWHMQFDSINKLRRIVQNHEDIIMNVSGNNMHILILDLMKLVESLRSSVAKNAMICLGQMVAKLKRVLDPEADNIVERLMKKATDTNVFIHDEVVKCLTNCCINISQSKILTLLTAQRENKNFAVKEVTIQMLAQMGSQERILKKQAPKLIELLHSFLSQGHLELRTKAKSTILEISSKMPDLLRILKPTVSASVYSTVSQLLAKYAVNPNTSMTARSIMTSGFQSPVPASPPKIQRKSSIRPVIGEHLEQKKELELQQSIAKSEKKWAKLNSFTIQNKKKIVNKITNFPPQFNSLEEEYEGCRSTDWKKRIEHIKNITDLAVAHPQEFCQYRNTSKYIDALSQQIAEPNIKVSVKALQTLTHIVEPLKPLVQANLSIITNNLFNCLSNNKVEVKQESQKACNTLLCGVDIGLVLQHVCQGCLYSLPKSRVNLVGKLGSMFQIILQNKNSLVSKHIIPLINKLVDENKPELMQALGELCKQMEDLMGNDLYVGINKPQAIKDLISR